MVRLIVREIFMVLVLKTCKMHVKFFSLILRLTKFDKRLIHDLTSSKVKRPDINFIDIDFP